MDKPVIAFIIGIILAIGIYLLIRGMLEARSLKITRDTISRTDREGDPDLRIFYFSDLHAEFCFIHPADLTALIRREYEQKGLDMVVFGGDTCNNPLKVQKAVDYLNRIKEVCDSVGIPFLGVSGNHDQLVDEDDLDRCGYKCLDKKCITVSSRVDGSDIAITGVPDSGRFDRVWYDPPKIPEGCKGHILFAHNPDQILNLPEDHDVDIMISGHIHGGQIRTLLGIEFKLLRKDILPRRGIISGLHDVEGIKLFISKGIGCVFLPFRYKAPPEVNIIEIKL